MTYQEILSLGGEGSGRPKGSRNKKNRGENSGGNRSERGKSGNGESSQDRDHMAEIGRKGGRSHTENQ